MSIPNVTTIFKIILPCIQGNQMKRKGFPEAMHEIENNPDIKTREQLIAEGAVSAELMVTEGDEGVAGAAPEETPPKTTPARQRKKSGTPSASSAPVSSAAAAIAKSAASMLANTTPTAESTPPARSARGAKRKAEDTPAATPPPSKQRAEMATPSSQPTSRSGRVIKQKRFLDDQDVAGGEQPLTPTAATVSKRAGGGTPVASQKEQRKMWVQVSCPAIQNAVPPRMYTILNSVLINWSRARLNNLLF